MQAPGRTPRWTRGAAAAVAAWLLAGPAHGQLGATVAVDSDYRSRGVSLSDSNPSPRLTLNYEGAQRWYAGASATRAALTEQDTYPQLIGYAGWVASAVDGRSIEIGVVGSTFAGCSCYDFLEA